MGWFILLGDSPIRTCFNSPLYISLFATVEPIRKITPNNSNKDVFIPYPRSSCLSVSPYRRLVSRRDSGDLAFLSQSVMVGPTEIPIPVVYLYPPTVTWRTKAALTCSKSDACFLLIRQANSVDSQIRPYRSSVLGNHGWSIASYYFCSWFCSPIETVKIRKWWCDPETNERVDMYSMKDKRTVLKF